VKALADRTTLRNFLGGLAGNDYDRLAATPAPDALRIGTLDGHARTPSSNVDATALRNNE
jgi:hypothetical protein